MLDAEEGLRPLLELIHVVSSDTQCVFNSMLRTWYLVKDRQGQFAWFAAGCLRFAKYCTLHILSPQML